MKSKGHIYMANLLMKEMKEKGTVTIGNFGTYCIPSDVKNAILAAPKAFRAGAVGPDFYPDMLIGQVYFTEPNGDIDFLYNGRYQNQSGAVESRINIDSKDISNYHYNKNI